MKKFLTILLALVMSLSMMSLFACSEETEEPVVEPPVVEEEKKDEIVGKTVIDWQVYGSYELVYAVDGGVYLDGKLLDCDYNKKFIPVTADMLSGDEIEIKYSDDGANYTQKVTFNKFTENYYNLDTDTSAAGYKLATTAKATGLKVNGVEIDAKETGITVADDGISFSMSYLNGKKGHNKVEYVAGDTNYIVSVCVITNQDLWSAMTFEDGKLNPFMSVYSEAEIGFATAAEVTTGAKFSDTWNYANGGAGNLVATYDKATKTQTQANNTKALKITNNGSEKAETIIWISMDYYKARIAAVEDALKGLELFADNNDTKNRIGCGRMIALSATTEDTSWDTFVPSATEGEDDVRLTGDGWGLTCKFGTSVSYARPNWDSLGSRPDQKNADAPYFYFVMSTKPGTVAFFDDICMANSTGYGFSTTTAIRNIATIIK